MEKSPSKSKPVLLLSGKENKEEASYNSLTPDPDSDARARARAKAVIESGELDDYKLRPMVTITTQAKAVSQGQLVLLYETEAFVAGMQRAKAFRGSGEEHVPAVSLAARGYWSRAEAERRLREYERVLSDWRSNGRWNVNEERGWELAEKVADLRLWLERQAKP